MAKNEDALEEMKRRRKKRRRLRWLEEEAERHMRPVRWRPKGRQ